MSKVKLKVLVVDKPDIYSQALVELLTEGGYNVDFCSDADTAYRKLRTSVRPFELLIIDLDSLQNLDGESSDGYVFLKAVSREELYQDMKVIITTNALLDERLGHSEELNICAYFNKTRTIDEFFLIVTDIIPPSGKDLRYCRRIPLKILISYTVGGNTALHYASNLSHSGIFVQSAQPDPVGTVARLSFNVPGCPTAIEVTARVMRIVQYDGPVSSLRNQNFPQGMGMAFQEISEEHKSFVRAFLDKEEIRIFGSKRS